MKKRTFLAAVAGAVGAVVLGRPARAEKKEPEGSPHAAALALVFQKAAARVREVDQENWWHDTKERTWVARRPVGPGIIDSTHLFDVAYRIDGKPAAAWMVDTKKGTVTERPADPPRKG